VAFGDFAESLRVRAWHLNGVVKQPAEECVLVHRSIDQVPYWEGRDEGLPKHDQVSTRINGLLNERIQLINGSVTVEKYRGCLHCCCAELWIHIAWHNDLQRLSNIYVHGFRTQPSPHHQEKTAQRENHDLGVCVVHSQSFQTEHVERRECRDYARSAVPDSIAGRPDGSGETFGHVRSNDCPDGRRTKIDEYYQHH